KISKDGGKHWATKTLATVGASAFGANGIDVSRSGGKGLTHVLAWATNVGVFESRDGGNHWMQLGKFKFGGTSQISDASYIGPTGDVLVVRTQGTVSSYGQQSVSCTSTATLTRYSGSKRAPSPVLQPPKKVWGTLVN